MLSKNFNNKKCAHKLVFFNEKKMRKIWMVCDIEYWLWKSNFGTFWQLAIDPKLKIQWYPLDMLILRQKSCKNFVSPAWKLHNPYCHTSRFSSEVIGLVRKNISWFIYSTYWLGCTAFFANLNIRYILS